MKGGDNMGFGSVAQNLTDPGSRVAKVGDASAPSLRVDPGARGQVEVPGKPPCVRGSGPCYYVGQSDPPPPLCEDFPKIRFCDAVVSELQNPAEVPALELRNRQELRVQQPRPDGAWTEVVVSSDDSILPPDGFGCDDLGDGTCAHPVAVADDLDGFDVTLVVLDDEGYVTASLAVPFEVHGVAALSLSRTSCRWRSTLDRGRVRDHTGRPLAPSRGRSGVPAWVAMSCLVRWGGRAPRGERQEGIQRHL
nr:uncharacterized protein LOC113826413 [Penaeus vannamei]